MDETEKIIAAKNHLGDVSPLTSLTSENYCQCCCVGADAVKGLQQTWGGKSMDWSFEMGGWVRIGAGIWTSSKFSNYRFSGPFIFKVTKCRTSQQYSQFSLMFICYCTQTYFAFLFSIVFFSYNFCCIRTVCPNKMHMKVNAVGNSAFSDNPLLCYMKNMQKSSSDWGT